MSSTSAEKPPPARDDKPTFIRRPATADIAIFWLKVQLKGTRPAVWRRLSVHGDTTLAELHEVLQLAFGWADSHLHRFEITGIQYGLPDPDDDVNVRDERRYDLFALVGEGATFRYVYDFGDDWVHAIKVEKVFGIDSPLFENAPPFCHGGRRAGPPEDIGGPRGFADFLAALPDPDRDVDPDSRLLELQVGLIHDPVTFDRWALNRRLRELWAQRVS